MENPSKQNHHQSSPHAYILALGSYRNSPFVTGQASKTNGLKTEIFDMEANEWVQLDDYPFSNGDRYVDFQRG